jgi:hypothetical protein
MLGMSALGLLLFVGVGLWLLKKVVTLIVVIGGLCLLTGIVSWSFLLHLLPH